MSMGSGASAKDQSTVLPLSSTEKDHLGAAIMGEGSVQWLCSIIDKEKREKEWLASKYDEQSAQVRMLQKEVAELQQELHGMALDVIAKVPGDVAAITPGKTSALLSCSLQDQSSPVSPAGSGKLKERRGMRSLSIETPLRARNADAMQTQKVESKDNMESKEARQTPPGDVISSATASAPGIGPLAHGTERKTGSRLMGHEGGEPASALLRRRKEDWQVMATVLENDNTAAEAESPTIKDLHIRASKVQDLDCPYSPKRPGRKRDEF